VPADMIHKTYCASTWATALRGPIVAAFGSVVQVLKILPEDDHHRADTTAARMIVQYG
jgi:hypothetical protein